jgi:hypothetical protein
MSRKVSVLALVTLVCALCYAIALWAQEKPAPTGGTVIGILTAKGETWIEVKAEGEKEAVRYVPFWHGGTPNQGGGFDRQMIEIIKKIPVSNLVKLTWQMQEHRRIVSLETIVPKEKSGTVVGRVVAKSEAWVDVKPEGGPTERYLPRWSGGAPNAGGSLNRDTLRAIAALTIGQKVRIQWTYDERKRVIKIERL